MDRAFAPAFLTKLRHFATEELTAGERAAFAALIAPGLAMIYDDSDVQAFDATRPLAPVPAVVADLIRTIGWTLEDDA